MEQTNIDKKPENGESANFFIHVMIDFFRHPFTLSIMAAAVIWTMACFSYEYLTRDDKLRVNVEELQLNEPMTQALNRARSALLEDVPALHCWFQSEGKPRFLAAIRVLCEAQLEGRARSDLGADLDIWDGTVFAGPNRQNMPLEKQGWQISAFIENEFNFVVRRRNNNELVVLSNVSKSAISFNQASGFVKALVQQFNTEQQAKYASLKARASDTIKATWDKSDG